MPMAFVMIDAEAGTEQEVLKAINKLNENKDVKKLGRIKEAYCVYGNWDVVAYVEGTTIENLKDIVTWHIRRLEHVKYTVTMLVAESSKNKK